MQRILHAYDLNLLLIDHWVGGVGSVLTQEVGQFRLAPSLLLELGHVLRGIHKRKICH